MDITKSVIFFLAAGLCEIGGGYLVWLWAREGKSRWYALTGAVLLVLYGVVPTLQTANFGRVYAAYGGVFIVLSILWGWQVDRFVPDRFDLLGGAVALAGVLIIMYAPRG
jgi:small multidrug resistance family-3 protein